MTSRNKTKL